MPQWIAELTLAQVVLFVAGIGAVGTALWKIGRPLLRAAKKLSQLADDWMGTPERLDSSGSPTSPARPGVAARLTSLEEATTAQNRVLETVRSQVQNSHSTNLRDDLDSLSDQVAGIVAKLDDHIHIAIESDRRQDATAEQVSQIAARWGDRASPQAGSPPTSLRPANAPRPSPPIGGHEGVPDA